MEACASCGTANPKGARFCNGCAASLASVSSAREERKTVTVLFADLAGFTSRSEFLDPEDVRAFLLPYYDALTSEVARHGGHVDRFLGDGIMALFGAPTAHEDDPERAVRAALRILERVPALGLDLHVRVGINTGPVLFAAAGGDRDDSVTGDAVNTAARLQAAAPTDGVVVGEATYRATNHLFRYEAMEPISAKGKAEPVPLWRPLEPIARTSGELGEETTHFVGRAFELETLVRLFERARATPSLEVVTIVADPGIGKSRLVRELARYVEALPDLVTWRVGRCLPYGEGIGFWALGEIIKGHAGILDTDDQVTLSAKLDAVLTESDPSLRSWMKDRMGPLVGLQVTTEPPQQEEAFTAWRRFLESVAAARPTVLIVEDLHWADDALVAFLQHLAANTAGLPILLVATARPELEERHPTWLGRARRSTVLSLAALRGADMTSLVEATLPGASPELVATVLRRAAGSPLYAEQLAAMFRDRLLPVAGGALDEDTIPPTIAALLAARIDALPPEAKAVLLDASVVGKTFWSGAVAGLGDRDRGDVEPLLAELARRELVRPVYPSSMAGQAEYAFVHALVRDVAYSDLPRTARLARHRSTAAWISEHAGAALGENAEIVVAHLERALELATAMGATGETPVLEATLADALLAAADTAARTKVPRAVGHLRRALALLSAAAPQRPEVLARLGRALNAGSDYLEAAAVLEEARAVLQARNEDRAAAELAAPLAVALFNVGRLDAAEAILSGARDLLERDPGPGLVGILAEQAVLSGNAERADMMDRAEKAIAVAASLGLPPPPRALNTRGVARFPSDAGAAELDFQAAIDGAMEAGDVRTVSATMQMVAIMRSNTIGPAAGLDAFDETVRFCEDHGLPTARPRAIRAQLLLDLGRWVELLPEADDIWRWALQHGDIPSAVSAGVSAAFARLELGETIESADQLSSMARDLGVPTLATPIAAEWALIAGDIDAARRALDEGLRLTPDGELWGPVAFVRACIRAGVPDLARRALAATSPRAPTIESEAAAAMIAESVGEYPAARSGYERAAEVLAAQGCLGEQAYALAGLGRCLLRLGEAEEGIARLGEARAIWQHLRATPRIAAIDATLASAGAS